MSGKFSIIFCILLFIVFMTDVEAQRVRTIIPPRVDLFQSSFVDVGDASASSMGLPGKLNENDFNAFGNPSQIMQYGTAYGEVWNGQAWGGATVVLLGIKFGIFLGRPYQGSATNFLQMPSSVNGSDAGNYVNQLYWDSITGVFSDPSVFDISALAPFNHADIFMGFKFDSVAIGVKFTYADNSDRQEFTSIASPTNTYTSNFGKITKERYTADHHISLGLLFIDFGPFKTLGVSADIGLLSFENSYIENDRKDKRMAENKFESDNSPTLSFLLRPIMDLSIGRLIVPMTLTKVDNSSKGSRLHDRDGDGLYTNMGFTPDVNDAYLLSDKTTDIAVDLALHTNPTKQLKVIYATGIHSTKREMMATIVSNLKQNAVMEESKASTVSIPFGVSVEHETLKWFKIRFGAHKLIYSKSKIEAKDENYNGNKLANTLTLNTEGSRDLTKELSIALGMGLIPAEKLSIDIAFNAAMNANYTFENLVSHVSMKYHY